MQIVSNWNNTTPVSINPSQPSQTSGGYGLSPTGADNNRVIGPSNYGYDQYGGQTINAYTQPLPQSIPSSPTAWESRNAWERAATVNNAAPPAAPFSVPNPANTGFMGTAPGQLIMGGNPYAEKTWFGEPGATYDPNKGEDVRNFLQPGSGWLNNLGVVAEAAGMLPVTGATQGFSQGVKYLTGATQSALAGAGGLVGQRGAVTLPDVGNTLKTIGKEIVGIEPKATPIAKFTGELKKAADDLVAYIKGAPTKARAEQDLLYHKALSEKAGKIASAAAGDLPLEEKMAAMSAARGGELPKVLFDPPVQRLDPNIFDLLATEITNNTKLKPFERANAMDALKLVWYGGTAPQPNQIESLIKIFGEDIAKAVTQHSKTLSGKIGETLMSIAGIPRALMASIDQSAWFRQGILYTTSHPLKALKNMWSSLKSAAYSKWAFEADDLIRNHPDFDLFKQAGFYMSPLRKEMASLGQLEESFATKAVQHIPGIRQSERAYVNYLNKARFDIFENMMDSLRKLGIEPDKVSLDSWVDLVNIGTGRGKIGSWKKSSELAVALNNIFFSPRLMMSRFQLPKVYAQLLAKSVEPVPSVAKYARKYKDKLPGELKAIGEQFIDQRSAERVALKEATRQIASFVAFGISSLILTSLTTGAKVELDPRSSDFAKIKLGDTRIDPWGGWQQYVKFFAQVLTGERKVTSTGGIRPVNQFDVLINFLVSKANPAVGLATDILRGKTVVGEEMEATPEGIGKQAFNRLVPLFIQDMVDAFASEGLIGIAKGGVPGFIGMGVTTYPDVLTEKQKAIGTTVEGEPYTLNKFGSDVGRYGYSLGDNAAPLPRFYFEYEKNLEDYYKVADDDKFAYRKQNPEIDAALFFWGKVSNVQTPEAADLVTKWLKEYNLPDSALRNEIAIYGNNKSKSDGVILNNDVIVPPAGYRQRSPAEILKQFNPNLQKSTIRLR